ncbi:hypothetical protein KL918_001901 [Ogataea parapolymorpha]|uniref:tryptophan--tRNA ligase n=1 Tax=Ogataea parapolymorpha (strain ATCC 26012 / BCRC 20466 / JCM 22074 / NRRL Y-7560 / DL-1) TaxID=871575 RepID=W1QCF6_OGAPD|nr:Tryptophan--tRNA ligase, mitochondrial [Ogataea parapolymorpha DL-1]ESW98707.1 Tryptophan--tRNA ligase, mitochondrial [Ogataea parapolymorpha DL-1]KAG7868243.1 hypothetical protein KL918_001901 [Ogataea parapolymorpha]KAG7874137.1 hypothetical protein KL916_001477 [Ogataea parapolymorpha]
MFRRFVSTVSVEYVNSPTFSLPRGSMLVSGIQPTGAFHLGNYLGATKTWHTIARKLDPSSQMVLFIADLHSLTVPQNYSVLKKQRFEAYASLLACGLDPAKVTIYHQAAVPEHTQLQWALTCFAGMGLLNRMTQWKAKADLKNDAQIQNELGAVKLGLFAYPVLMAADVLLFNATHVPVGQDQAQHLELTRDLVSAFNKQTKTKFFHYPKTLMAPSNKILNLRDPSKKMSKSDPDELTKITITEDPKSMRMKIMKATTDSIDGPLTFDPEQRPGISNLITIYSAIANQTIEETVPQIKDLSKRDLKELVAEAVVKELQEPNRVYKELMSSPDLLHKLSLEGADKARAVASKNLKEVYKILGMDMEK